MLSKIYSAALHGLNAYIVSVQVDESNGLPRSLTLGNVSASVKEAIERVSIALKNLGMELPPKKITINLQPADLRKTGSSFDLPIFMGTLLALYPKTFFPYENYGFIGELGLDGEIRPVPGVLPMVLALEEAGLEGVFVPKENEAEATNCEKLKIIACSHITELMDICKISYGNIDKENNMKQKTKNLEEKKTLKHLRCAREEYKGRYSGNEEEQNLDFQDVAGQSYGIRAALIAAAGHHALLFSGPAGTGKSMIAKRIPGILPKMTRKEKLDLSKIYSIASCLPSGEALIEKRPFRAPHSTVSQNTLLGGMVSGRLIPGELALAGKGVLFLDELPLFKKESIEALRGPMEEKKVSLHRLQQFFSYPVDCLFVAAMNPCPCGFFPDRNRCHCTPGQIRAYQRGISKPILERMDLCVSLPAISLEEALSREKGISSAVLRKQVERAQRMQEKRFLQEEELRWNGDMNVTAVKKYCVLSKEEEAYMENIFRIKNLSMRTYHKILKIARTIADLEEMEEMNINHLAEAVSYRGLEEELFSFY